MILKIQKFFYIFELEIFYHVREKAVRIKIDHLTSLPSYL